MSPASLRDGVPINKTGGGGQSPPRCSGVLPPTGTTYISSLGMIKLC